MPVNIQGAAAHGAIALSNVEGFRSKTGRQRRARTSRRMLEALFSIVENSGARGLSVDMLHNAAGLSRGAFYNYYNTLDEFLIHVSDLLGAIINDEQRNLFENERSAIAQIADCARYFVMRATSDSASAAILLQTLPATGASSEPMRHRMEATFSRAKEAGEIDIPSIAQAVEMSLGVLIAMLRLAVRDGTDANQLSAGIAILLRGLGVSKAKAIKLSSRPLPPIMPVPLRLAALERGLTSAEGDQP